MLFLGIQLSSLLNNFVETLEWFETHDLMCLRHNKQPQSSLLDWFLMNKVQSRKDLFKPVELLQNLTGQAAMEVLKIKQTEGWGNG